MLIVINHCIVDEIHKRITVVTVVKRMSESESWEELLGCGPEEDMSHSSTLAPKSLGYVHWLHTACDLSTISRQSGFK